MTRAHGLITSVALALLVAGVAHAQTTKWVDQSGGSDADDGNSEATAYATLQFAIDNSTSGTAATRSVINVKDGTYGLSQQALGCEGFPNAILVANLGYLTIQAVAGHEPVVTPVTAVEANIVSINIVNCDHLIIDNIDSDQTIAQFDNWHVCDSDDLTVRNSLFEGGEDGIDFNTGLMTALIENNHFLDINTGNGDEVLDFTDGTYSDVVIQDNLFENNYRQVTINPPTTASDFTIRRNFMDGTVSQEHIRLISAADVVVENNVMMNGKQQGVYVDNGCSFITIRHNTFFNNDQEGGGQGEIRTKVTTADIVIQDNILHGNGSNPAIETSAGSLPGEDYNLWYDTVQTFTFGPSTFEADPLFVATAAGSEDLHLQDGSPALEAGTDLGVTDDIEKSARPSPAGTDPDMGAYEMGPPPPVEVGIDIKPGSDPNSINRRSNGEIPVAILSTDDFDAVAEVDQGSLTFGRTGTEDSLRRCNGAGEDVDGDLDLDLVCHFGVRESGFECGDTHGRLEGELLDATSIFGVDSVRIVPCN